MTKNIFTLILILTLFSCKQEVAKDYATVSGTITNHLGKDGKIRNRNYSKEIKINPDGTFSDTFHIKNEASLFNFTDGNESTSLYLKNGDNINLTLDTKLFDETVKYTGSGSENSNYLAQKALLSEKTISMDLFDASEDEFDSKTSEIIAKFTDFLTNATGLDERLIISEKEEIARMEEGLKKQYARMKAEKDTYASFVGNPSPEFNDFENINGSKTSLKDFKGKYVYIDVWATWCGPCIAEIPSLKRLEKEYHGKNIEFISISIDDGASYKDNSKDAAKKGWKIMIAKKELKGTQLLADNGWQTTFARDYSINSIPRFILIDDKGNVVDANAPRPSSERIKDLLKSLNL